MRRVDSFGIAQFGHNGPPIRARLIQISEIEYAFFPEDQDHLPVTLRFEDSPRIRGRVLSGTILAEGPQDFSFARASCGCQTPKHLRGPARVLLAQLPPESPSMWTQDGKPIPFPDGVVPV